MRACVTTLGLASSSVARSAIGETIFCSSLSFSLYSLAARSRPSSYSQSSAFSNSAEMDARSSSVETALYASSDESWSRVLMTYDSTSFLAAALAFRIPSALSSSRLRATQSPTCEALSGSTGESVASSAFNVA